MESVGWVNRRLDFCSRLLKCLCKRHFLEKRNAEDLQDTSSGREIEFFLKDGDQHVDADGDPDLGLDRVLGGPEERLDAQVLLDPFEEQFHLPAASVELRRW